MKSQATVTPTEAPHHDPDPGQPGAKRPERDSRSFLARLLARKRSTARPKGPRPGTARPLGASDHESPDEPPCDQGELFRSLVNHIGIGIFRTTPGVAGRFLEVNPAMERITGYSRAELLKMDVADLYVHPEERMDVVRRALADGSSGHTEVLFKRKDGTVILVRDTKVAVNSDDGLAIYLEGFLEDITERKKAEDALRLETEGAKQYVDIAGVMVLALDSQRRVTLINAKGCEILGRRREDVIGRDWLEFLPERMKAEVLGAFEKVISGDLKPVEYFENPILDTRGVEKTVAWHNSVIRDGMGNIVGTLSSGEDITEHRKAEEALRESEKKYRDLVENAPVGIAVSSPDGRVFEVNKALQLMHRYDSKEEFMASSVSDRFNDTKDRDRWVQMVRETGKVQGYEVLTKRKDGSLFWTSITSIPRITEQGEQQLITVSQDVTERRLAEDRLRQSEKKYSTLVEQGTDMITIFQDRQVKFVNSRVTGILGFAVEDVVGHPFGDFVAEPYRQLVADRYAKRISGERAPRSYEVELLARDGRQIPVEISASAVEYEGRPADMVVTRDITERKKAEEALLISDSALRSIHEGVITMDDRFMVTRWNEICEKMFGVAASDAVGKNIGDVLTMVEEHPGQNKERLDLLLARGYNREEQLYRCPAGDVWVDVHAQAIESDGRRHGWVTLVADITECKGAEEALRQSEEKLRMMFQAVAEGVAVVDTNGIVTRVNGALLAMYGLKSEDDVIGKHCRLLVAPEDHERMRQSLRPVLQQGAVNDVSLTGFRPDGQRISIEMSAGLLRDAAGNPIGSVVTVRDVTEAERMHEQLLAQNRLASIGELVSGVAHEINNPLTGVIGFSELLLQQDVPDHLKDDLVLISKEAKPAGRIIKDLLTFARKHPATKQPAKIDGIVEDVLRLRAYEHTINNIGAVRHFAADLPEVTVDYHQMQQVFLNIIINAEYFMAEAHHRGTLTITGEVADGKVRISIADDGPGIPLANLSRIFDPFFTTKDVGKGTGLGLSICHGIVTEHGGRIYATSEPGKGATFVVEFPIDPPEED